eukprot:3111760-Amphidinium_carterae.1
MASRRWLRLKRGLSANKASHVFTADGEVEQLGDAEIHVVDVELLLVTLALLVLVEMDAVNANLVVLMEVSVEVVRVSVVDEVEVLAVGTVLAEHLMLPPLFDVLDDVDANHEVTVGVDVEVDLLGVAENRLVDVEMLLMTLALPARYWLRCRGPM